MHPNIHSSTIHNSQDAEASYISTKRWMHKDMVYGYNGILLSCEMEWNNGICSKLDGMLETPEYWSGEPIPFPADLPHPGIEPGSATLQADSLPTELSEKPILY